MNKYSIKHLLDSIQKDAPCENGGHVNDKFINWDGALLHRLIIQHLISVFFTRYDNMLSVNDEDRNNGLISIYDQDVDAVIRAMQAVGNVDTLSRFVQSTAQGTAYYVKGLDATSSKLQKIEYRLARIGARDKSKRDVVMKSYNKVISELRNFTLGYYHGVKLMMRFALINFIAAVLVEDNFIEFLEDEATVNEFIDNVISQTLGDTWFNEFKDLHVDDYFTIIREMDLFERYFVNN